ncbi:FMN-dependent alpha-hydroxy acid dehydrogenase [Histoplasma capsulatum var. duboisii H88]|uniref:FMN-dependent alpha-hydroxy acid dehydrogenase n=1 Tax=Ajellomyces capsulatus (strain H88) TaxID=544711 RepID=F0UMG8_AJEC8|nr:FMN-dependent alpha-hydroxy acid dehydrogenase [Histoplasma capsulatum var. duboisii H88]
MLSVEQRKRYPIPIGISPSAMQKLVGDDGEIDIAKAAGSWGTNMILSSHTTCTLEDVIQAPGGDNLVDYWFQLNISHNRERCVQLCSRTNLKIILKGIMTVEDTLLAIGHGADAIIVSNNEGRQLDSVPSRMEVLPEIVSAVRGRVPVIIESGITRGSDVFKALALGADFTLVGRSALWGLNFGGQEGSNASGKPIKSQMGNNSTQTSMRIGNHRVKESPKRFVRNSRDVIPERNWVSQWAPGNKMQLGMNKGGYIDKIRYRCLQGASSRTRRAPERKLAYQSWLSMRLIGGVPANAVIHALVDAVGSC